MCELHGSFSFLREFYFILIFNFITSFDIDILVFPTVAANREPITINPFHAAHSLSFPNRWLLSLHNTRQTYILEWRQGMMTMTIHIFWWSVREYMIQNLSFELYCRVIFPAQLQVIPNQSFLCVCMFVKKWLLSRIESRRCSIGVPKCFKTFLTSN